MVETYMQQKIRRNEKLSFMTNWKGTTRLFQEPNAAVLDLGAAPGGWSKYVAEKLGSDGLLIAIDLLPLDHRTVSSIENRASAPAFHIIQGDFTTESVKINIIDILQASASDGVHYVISDMAANFTGDSMTDALRTMHLCEDALMLAAGPSCFDEQSTLASSEEQHGILIRGGTFLCKYFACGQQHEKDIKDAVRRNFEFSTVLKPKASRKESAELYLFATGYRGGELK
jgi:23S rRNA (uridine2552-2'-O)-methyltransferase